MSAPFVAQPSKGYMYDRNDYGEKIGLLIKEEFDRQGHSIGWLSRRLACDRSNVYRLFQRESIDTETLKRLCRILDHDFFRDLSRALHEDSECLVGTVGSSGPLGGK